MIAQASISSPPEQRSYYVYTLARPDGSVFYVGKGSGKRIHYHEMLVRSDPNKEKCEVIRQILALGKQVIKTIVYETPVEKDAYLYEWVLITMVYGRENLTNRADGGNGYTGEHAQTNRKPRTIVFAKHLPIPATTKGMNEKRYNFIDLRIDAGFNSQTELAQAARLTKSTVWLAENGKPISYKSARKIVNALKQRGIAVEVEAINWHVGK